MASCWCSGQVHCLRGAGCPKHGRCACFCCEPLPALAGECYAGGLRWGLPGDQILSPFCGLAFWVPLGGSLL